MSKLFRNQMLDKIRKNINKYGFHQYIIMGGTIPRYSYTIGLNETLGAELVLAGAIYYSGDDVTKIINGVNNFLTNNKKDFGEVFIIEGLGSFVLKKVVSSWQMLLQGALDYYNINSIESYQIIPDNDHFTIDIPCLYKDFNSLSEKIWKWLKEEWSYNIPSDSSVVTNLKAMYGERITEVTRWEENEWEMFAGNGTEVTKEDARIVPLATLLGFDPTLIAALDLPIGKGLWRDDIKNSYWNKWECQ